MRQQLTHRRCPAARLLETLAVAHLLLAYCQVARAFNSGSAVDLRELKVQCSRSGLTVHVQFDEPFYGIIYSQNYYQVPQCTYVTSEASNGRASFSFNVPQKGCGTVSQTGSRSSSSSSSSSANAFHRALDVRQQHDAGQHHQDMMLENTIIIQHDPDFQEVGDMARRLRCVWGAQALQKSVNAKMSEVYEPSLITVKYDYRSVNQLVEIQSARGGPLAQPATGFISSSPGQSSLVIYLKNPAQRFDANVLSCSYFDGKTGETVKLTDDDGCTVRPDLTSSFYKFKEATNPNSDLTLYTYFRGLRVGRDTYFGMTCNVEICFSRCGDRCRNRIV